MLSLANNLGLVEQSSALGKELPCGLTDNHRVNRTVELAVATALEALEEQHDLGNFEMIKILIQGCCTFRSRLRVHLPVRACILVDVVDVAEQIRRAGVLVCEMHVQFGQGRVVARNTFHVRDVHFGQSARSVACAKRLEASVIVCQRQAVV